MWVCLKHGYYKNKRLFKKIKPDSSLEPKPQRQINHWWLGAGETAQSEKRLPFKDKTIIESPVSTYKVRHGSIHL